MPPPAKRVAIKYLLSKRNLFLLYLPPYMYCVFVSASGRVQSWRCKPSKKAPGGGCQFRRESFVIILASERKFSREALLSLRPQDQCYRAGRRRAAVASIREMEHWSFEDAFKDFQLIDRRQRCLGRARQFVMLYGEHRGKKPAGCRQCRRKVFTG